MIVVILYGRSWQGVADATRIIGNAAFVAKLQVQNFLEEESKAFARGCVKMDRQAIESRQPEQPDYLLVFDTKMDTAQMLKQAGEKSTVIFNSRERLANPVLKKEKIKAFFVDATGIAVSAMHRPMPQAAMLGAFARLFGKIPARNIKTQLSQQETLAFDEGFKNVKRN